jgi:hypothetical protein
MPERLKQIFEKEYMAKGYSKRKADSIFYGYESKQGMRRKS